MYCFQSMDPARKREFQMRTSKIYLVNFSQQQFIFLQRNNRMSVELFTSLQILTLFLKRTKKKNIQKLKVFISSLIKVIEIFIIHTYTKVIQSFSTSTLKMSVYSMFSIIFFPSSPQIRTGLLFFHYFHKNLNDLCQSLPKINKTINHQIKMQPRFLIFCPMPIFNPI